METQAEDSPQHGQIISVTRKDTTRLMEVYVKRSLSLNDGSPIAERRPRRKKWVTMPERQKRIRRSSSDPSVPLASLPTEDLGEDLEAFAAVETPPTDQSETVPEETVKKKKKKKKKRQKSSLWKRFLGLFSGKEEEPVAASGPEMPDVTAVSSSDPAATGLPHIPDPSRRRKSLRRRFSKKRLSLRKSVKQTPITEVGLVSVEPTYAYYEKVSEEMQKIVHEVKEKEEVLTDEEVIKRIISLTKEEGDAIDQKLRDNPTLSNFFQGMSYTSFQKLADTYVDMSPVQSQHPTVLPTAPELVKLAFTLDFTARVASLSRQNIGHITGLGTRYLDDRFEYKQACTDHPWSDCDDAND